MASRLGVRRTPSLMCYKVRRLRVMPELWNMEAGEGGGRGGSLAHLPGVFLPTLFVFFIVLVYLFFRWLHG